MLFDAHTHLNYEEFSEEERLDRAREIEESDVEFIIDVGDSVESLIILGAMLLLGFIRIRHSHTLMMI